MTWRCIHPDTALYDQVVAEFKRIYQNAGKPSGVALFESTDTVGKVVALCLTPMAAPLCQSVFDLTFPWSERDSMHEGASISCVVGDTNAMFHPGNKVNKQTSKHESPQEKSGKL